MGKNGINSIFKYLFLLVLLAGCTSSQPHIEQSQLEPKPNISSSLTFLVYGDSREGHEMHRALLAEMLEEEHSFVLHTGDFVNHGGRGREWKVFQEIAGGLNLYPTVGNHDYPLGNYLKTFNVSPYYSFDHKYIHVVSLNVYQNFSEGSEQYMWLNRDLNSTNASWVVVLTHAPPYSGGAHGSSKKVRVLVPLLERYGVDLVFSGHDHNYQRSYPLIDNERAQNGILYLVTGGGGAELYEVEPKWFTASYAKRHHFVKVELNRSLASIEAIDKEGRILDSYVLENS